MRYHLEKQTRLYTGKPYCGPTSRGIPAEFNTLEEAVEEADLYQVENPVGWNVWDSETDKCVHGRNVLGQP